MPKSSLKAVIMHADRSRFGGLALTVLAVHTPAVLAVLPAWDALLGLVGLLAVVVVHRALFVKLMPALPAAAAPSLLELARTQWLLRGAGSLAFCVAALVASLGYHGVLLRACPATELMSYDDKIAAGGACGTADRRLGHGV